MLMSVIQGALDIVFTPMLKEETFVVHAVQTDI
jgi:hypothetical protein